MNDNSSTRSRIRLLAGATAAVGGLLVLQPHRVARRFSSGGARPNDSIVRVLGARQLMQGAAQFARPTSDLVRLGIGVDLLHLASMVALGAAWRTYRRPALASAAMAAISAGTGAVIISANR